MAGLGRLGGVMVSLFDEYGANEPPPMPGDGQSAPAATIPPPPASAPLADTWSFGGGSGGGSLHLPSLPVRRRRARRPKGRVFVTVGLVVALAAGAFVYLSLRRSSGGQATALSMSFPKGQTFSYGLSMTMDGTIRAGSQSGPLKGTITETLSWKVASVDAKGIATVALTAGNISGNFNGQPVSNTSQYTTTIQVAPDGRILVGGDLASTTGGSGFSFPGTDQFTPILPDHPVKPGDTWTKTFDQTLPFGGSDLTYTSHNTFVRYEQMSGVKAAVIRSTMTVPLDITIDLRKLLDTYGQGASIPKGSHPTIVYGGSVSLDQTAWFDPVGGSLVKSLLAAQFDMQMQFKGFPSKQLPSGGQVAFAGSMTLSLTRQS
jgi:hypothetical protein